MTQSSVQIADSKVRVTRWDLPAGDETGLHRHEYDYVVVPLVAGRMEVTASDGTRSVAVLSPGTCYHRVAGVEHNVRNGGESHLSFVEIEVLVGEGASPAQGS